MDGRLRAALGETSWKAKGLRSPLFPARCLDSNRRLTAQVDGMELENLGGLIKKL
jgi:hypothetical protein